MTLSAVRVSHTEMAPPSSPAATTCSLTQCTHAIGSGLSPPSLGGGAACHDTRPDARHARSVPSPPAVKTCSPLGANASPRTPDPPLTWRFARFSKVVAEPGAVVWNSTSPDTSPIASTSSDGCEATQNGCDEHVRRWAQAMESMASAVVGA